jgi:glutaredoxin
MTRVELYGTPDCPYTRDMREWLEVRGSDLEEYDVETDREARERMRALVGAQRTVPVLVQDGAVVLIGWQGRGCTVSE